MKKLLIISSVCMMTFLLVSSFEVNKASFEPYQYPDFEALISEYNQGIELNFNEAQKGFIEEGMFESNILVNDEGKNLLVFSLKKFDEKGKLNNAIKFDFLCVKELSVPQTIRNARIVYMGNQLILIDTDGDFHINLYVRNSEESLNKTPTLNTLEGESLAIQKIKDLTLE
ncbi:MAG: hypothetical protein AAF388_20395, partial [Bacteroidota bacterium]